jgi:hypothetical protein
MKQVGAPVGRPAVDHPAPGSPAAPPPVAHVGRRAFRSPAPGRAFRDFPRRGRGPYIAKKLLDSIAPEYVHEMATMDRDFAENDKIIFIYMIKVIMIVDTIYIYT